MKPLRVILVVAGALAALVVVNLVAIAYTDGSDWAARVDGAEIGEREFLRELAQFRAHPTLAANLGPGADGTVPSQLASLWLGRLVQQELVEQIASERDIRPTAEQVQSAQAIQVQQFGGEEAWNAFPDWFRDRLVTRDTLFLAVIEEVGGAPTEADLLAVYEAARDELLQACASHILVETREQADALKAELDAGGDFGALAQAHSIDEASATRGGDLGCQRQGSYVEPFDSQVYALPLGAVSDPVETQFGFHLVKVASRGAVPFEEVRQELTQRAQEATQQRFADVLLARVEEADIEVNPKYGEFESGFEGPRVVQPGAPDPPQRLPTGGEPEQAPPPGAFEPVP